MCLRQNDNYKRLLKSYRYTVVFRQALKAATSRKAMGEGQGAMGKCGENGFILMGVVVPLFALLVLGASVALMVASRWVETRSALDQGMMEENVDSVLWTLRYYYHNAAVAATAPLDLTSAGTIINQSLATLGYTGGGPGTWADLDLPSNPEGLQLRITPLSITNPGTPTVLTQTGTILDGSLVAQGAFSFQIEQRSGYFTTELQQTDTLIFCQVPTDSLALSCLGDLSNLSGNLTSFVVGGTSFVHGQLDGVVPVDFSVATALQAGSYGSNITRSGQSLSVFTGQDDYRYQTEIAQERTDLTQASTDLRTTSVQRVAVPRSPIPSTVLVREGLAGDPSLTPVQSQLYRLNQPFYSVPQSNRFWLSHDPATGALTAAVSQFGEPNYCAGALPAPGGWIISEAVKTVAGASQLVLRIDPSLAPSPLFIGSTNEGVPGDYSNFIVELKSAPSLPNDFELITPNQIVITGDINTDNAWNLDLLANQVSFGYSHLSEVTFNGSLTSLSGSSPSPWLNANGIEQTAAQVNLLPRPVTSSPVYYYVTLLQRSE